MPKPADTASRVPTWQELAKVGSIAIGLTLLVWAASERFTKVEASQLRTEADVAEIKKTLNELAPRRIKSGGSAVAGSDRP
jgi:hypothetical protein